MDNVVRARSGGIKGQFIRNAYLTTSMGPSIPMNVADITELKVE
jgi:ribosomal protein L1